VSALLQEGLQTVLLVASVGGVAGIWFRLGRTLEVAESAHRRVSRLEDRLKRIEDHFFNQKGK